MQNEKDITTENQFTANSDFCKDTSMWSSHDGMASEIEVSEFIYALVRLTKPEFCFESGTYKGNTTFTIGSALNDNKYGSLVSTEVNIDYIKEAQIYCNDLPVEILHMSSLDYMPTQNIDFIFFDGLFENRIKEYNKFKEFFTEKTILVFHDTAPHKKQILRGYEDELNLVRIHTPRGITIAQVKQPTTSGL